MWDIGTTKKGIGPTYSTKMTRSGLRMCDLFDEQIFETKLRRLASGFQKRYGDLLKYDVDAEIAQYKVSHGGIACCDAKANSMSRLCARSLLPMSSTRSHSSHRPRRRTLRSWSRAPTLSCSTSITAHIPSSHPRTQVLEVSSQVSPSDGARSRRSLV